MIAPTKEKPDYYKSIMDDFLMYDGQQMFVLTDGHWQESHCTIESVQKNKVIYSRTTEEEYLLELI